MKLVFKYIKRHWVSFLLSTMFLTLEAAADLLQPTFMSYIVDRGIKNADVDQILHYGLIMLCIAAVGAAGALMRNYFSVRTSQTVALELRRDMYRSVQRLSLENIDVLQPAGIITRITNDVTQIQEFINSMMRMMVKAPITCIGAVALIIMQTPRQAPVLIVILIIVGFLILGNVKIGYPRFGRVQKKLDALNAAAREFLSSVRVVKAFNAEEAEEKKFNAASGELAAANTSALHANALFNPLINLAVNMGIVVLLYISRSQNAGEIGKLMASVNYMTQVLFALTRIANVINVAVRAMASSARIQEVFDEKPAQPRAENPLSPEIHGNIKFDNASFAYAMSAKDSISGISLTVRAGETLGIIGPTGAGKTTLINLIPRFYDATEGAVYIDGCNVNSMDEHTLRAAVAVVPQKALLFSGTIRGNLRWGNADASDEALWDALRAAQADGVVQDKKGQLDAAVEPGGRNFSGGQRQRLTIARALVRRPELLILDDSASALDFATDAALRKALSKLPWKPTVVLISQRVSSIRHADKIVVLDDGHMAGLGTHTQLQQTCPVYQEISRIQMGDDLDA